jgi:hypothetical protein
MLTRHCSLACAVLALFTHSAQAGVLVGSAQAATELGGTAFRSFDTNSFGVAAPPIIADSNTGQGSGKADGNVLGMLRIAAHGCIEPPLLGGTVSTAGGSGNVAYNDQFTIQSSTLPLGTPVVIDVRVIGGESNQIGDDIPGRGGSGTLNSADAAFSVALGINNPTAVGHYSFQDMGVGSVFAPPASGLFSAPQATTLMIAGHVGETFQLTASLKGQSSADVFPGDVGDVQVQAALVWGAVSETPGVTMVSTITGLNVPDTSNVTPEFVQGNMFPPLIDFLPTPEPGSIVLLALGTVALMLARVGRRITRA